MKNLTRLLFAVSMTGLVCFGPMMFGNKKSAVAAAPIAVDRYVATSGSDAANDCSVMGSPCATIQHAVDQSSSGDTIHVAAGLYTVAGLVTIDKTLTLLGAQAGVDAHLAPRAGPESIISNSQGTIVTASNVVIDGFTVQDSTNQAFTSYGILLNSGLVNPGFTGTQILNNIIQNNVAGLGLANSGPSQALIQHNLFKNNNPGTGSAFGTGIYTDQFVGGKVTNVLIDANKFINENNAGIGFSSTDTNNQDSNITITNNVIDSSGRGVYFFNTGSSSVTDNTITNCTDPTDGGSSVGIGVFGAVTDLTITGNNIQTGTKRGIRIISFIDQTHPNMNVQIHFNNIFGFQVAGLLVDDSPPSLGPALTNSPTFATCNWWGAVNGPTNPLNLLGSTGDNVVGSTIGLTDFRPWLLGLAPNALCGVPPAGAVTACKFYDANANGIMDGSDSPLDNWPITINPLPSSAVPQLATQLTTTGCVNWSELPDGQYTFSEGTPVQTSWIHTTASSQLRTITLGQTTPVSFGNVCVGPGGGLTIGFWGNKNGQNAIANCTGGTAGVMTFLSGLNLRNANGSNFDPANYSQFKNWLGSANATNMAYMLSAQLAAMELNVRCGGVAGGSLIYAPGTNSANSAGFATVNAIMAEANTELGLHGLTTSGSPFRSYQEKLKNALDAANNNLNFVQATPCTYTFQ